MTSQVNFSTALLAWFDLHGRKNLPWQKPITPYRVWLSEVMLQQTQVDTVIPYFLRFLESFPTVETLAKAPQDEVLHLWTGLGYYARARNLHKCAQVITDDFGGLFPRQLDELESLPGIGPSTAAAIASIAFERPTAILDGNVKRVLARFHAVEGWPGSAPVSNILWRHAHDHMPKSRCRDYTQAIMDLGATLCTRSKPRCNECPLQAQCKGLDLGSPTHFPGKKPKKIKPTKFTQMLIIKNIRGEILLEQRPQQGIWGGLWSLPEVSQDKDAKAITQERYGKVSTHLEKEEITHVFSHYTLKIQPVELSLSTLFDRVSESAPQLWYNLDSPQKLGLAAPVKKLLHG